MTQPVELGDFTFHADTGELHRSTAGDGPRSVHRLAPQPARLLSMLIEQPGRIVTREEIRQRLWPDVTVDFEQGLHFCVRQIRAALGDTADNPRYIETLPRRGYRLIVNGVGDAGPTDTAPRRSRRWLVLAAIFFAAVLTVAWIAAAPRTHPIRVAIMPFEPTAEMQLALGTAPIAELLLAKLTEADSPALGIIGPTTTQAYAADAESHRRLIADFDIEYLVNARFAVTDDGPFMLAELIRATDGVHVWVARFTDFDSPTEIAETIVKNVVPRLNNATGSELRP